MARFGKSGCVRNRPGLSSEGGLMEFHSMCKSPVRSLWKAVEVIRPEYGLLGKSSALALMQRLGSADSSHESTAHGIQVDGHQSAKSPCPERRRPEDLTPDDDHLSHAVRRTERAPPNYRVRPHRRHIFRRQRPDSAFRIVPGTAAVGHLLVTLTASAPVPGSVMRPGK